MLQRMMTIEDPGCLTLLHSDWPKLFRVLAYSDCNKVIQGQRVSCHGYTHHESIKESRAILSGEEDC